MRKLLISTCVIVLSGIYVAKTAQSQDGGVQSLIDRISLRTSKPAQLPLDLGDTQAISGDALASAAVRSAPDALPPLLFTPPADLGPPLPDNTPIAATRHADVAVAPTTPPSSAPAVAAAPVVIPPLPRLAPKPPQPAPQVALADPAPTPPPPPPTVPAAPSAVPVVPKGKYRDGTFTGTVTDAYYGLVQVRARVSQGKIAGVEVVQYPSDRRTSRSINSYALPLLEREVVVAQAANVHSITGATLTVRAYTQSLDAALRQAE